MSGQHHFTEDEQLFIGLCKHHNNELFRHKPNGEFEFENNHYYESYRN